MNEAMTLPQKAGAPCRCIVLVGADLGDGQVRCHVWEVGDGCDHCIDDPLLIRLSDLTLDSFAVELRRFQASQRGL